MPPPYLPGTISYIIYKNEMKFIFNMLPTCELKNEMKFIFNMLSTCEPKNEWNSSSICSPHVNLKQNAIRFGFMQERSPIMAAILFTKAMVQGRETKKSIYVCSLDAYKAFDIVLSHQLKFNVYQSSIRWCSGHQCTTSMWATPN